MEKKVSVLITTYNLESYVDETLESVMRQQADFDFEVLVGDDGSGDGTIDRVKEWQARFPERIRWFVMDRDPNVNYSRVERASKNRLHLLSHAAGEYVLFLDGDDVYTDDRKLQKQVDVLDQPENRDCVACAHNIYVYWSEERKQRLNLAEKSFRVSGKNYWKRGMYFHSDTVMFRNIFRQTGLSEIPDAYFDDNIIVYSLLKYGKIVYIPDIMANYRQLENSSWNSVDDMEKHLINLMDVDIELRMDPSLRHASVMRHMGDFYYMWKNRNQVPGVLADKYGLQARRDNLKTAQDWVDYQKQGRGKQMRMTCWFFFHLTQFSFLKITKIINPNKVN